MGWGCAGPTDEQTTPFSPHSWRGLLAFPRVCTHPTPPQPPAPPTPSDPLSHTATATCTHRFPNISVASVWYLGTERCTLDGRHFPTAQRVHRLCSHGRRREKRGGAGWAAVGWGWGGEPERSGVDVCSGYKCEYGGVEESGESCLKAVHRHSDVYISAVIEQSCSR